MVNRADIYAQLDRQGYRCQLTGRELTPENASLDHVHPISKGGSHSAENIQVIIKEANAAKGTLSEDEFLTLCRDVSRERGEG